VETVVFLVEAVALAAHNNQVMLTQVQVVLVVQVKYGYGQ
jgi:hypothetical protein